MSTTELFVVVFLSGIAYLVWLTSENAKCGVGKSCLRGPKRFTAKDERIGSTAVTPIEAIADQERQAEVAAVKMRSQLWGNTDVVMTPEQAFERHGTDYSDRVTDLIVSDARKKSHSDWVKGVKPYSGVAFNVDTFEPEAALRGRGLLTFRDPETLPSTGNPSSVNEVGPENIRPRPSVRPRFV